MSALPSSTKEQERLIIASDSAYKAGLQAIKQNDMERAIEFFGSCLEIRNECFGERSIEVASTYLKYGSVLFWKAQDDNTVFGANAPTEATVNDDGEAEKMKKSSRITEENANDNNDNINNNINKDREEDDEEEGDDADEENDDDDDDDDEEEETDMELAWKLLEAARLIYLEYFEDETIEKEPALRKERMLELASVFENLGDINNEQSNFEAAIEDQTKALEIYERELSLDDRRIAAVLSNMSLAYQMLDRFKEALQSCQRGIAVLKGRLKSLEEDDLKDEGRENKERIEEFETIQAVLGDFVEKELELKELADQERSAKDAIRAAFTSIGGVVKPDPNADNNEGIETDGFDKPQLNDKTTVVQVQQVRKVVPIQQAPVRVMAQPVQQIQPKRVAPSAVAVEQAPVRVQPKPTDASNDEPEVKKLKVTPASDEAQQENEPAPSEQCKQQ
jgi:tetratricopeptide (TPR) repeat protein